MTNRNPITIDHIQDLSEQDNGKENYALVINCPISPERDDYRVIGATHFCKNIQLSIHRNTLEELEAFANDLLKRVTTIRNGGKK